MKTCCIVGQQKLSKVQIELAEKEFKKHIATFINDRYTHFVTSLNNKIEVLFGKIILDLRKENKNISLEIILPYLKKVQSKEYRHILNNCDKSKYMFEKYNKMGSLEHISQLVKKSDLVIVVRNEKNNEKINWAIQIAKIRKKEIKIIEV